MARAQFEYDEVGNTFYYVIVSFFAVVLFPLTYFLWPSLPKRVVNERTGCKCEGDIVKQRKKEAVKPWERTKCAAKAVVLVVLWALFALLVYKVSQIKHEHVEYDPYKILGLDADAEVSEIKKKYRDLSKLHHPDKGGDAKTFDEIVKAYKALTDEETRQNWKLHGNPDGPRAITFGIALPKWIVSEQYGIWVLACYGFMFMIILPLVVGLWWYNSMKYSADKVLLETTRLYFYFLQKTPNMEVNRILMVLAGSFEFWTKFNAEIVQRETDDVEVPRVMKELRNLGEKKREPPFCHPWSVKARTMLHAYLSRIELNSPRLDSDQLYIISRSITLMDEYIRVLMQMMLQIPMQRPPTLDTLENLLRIFPMIVQALWPRNSTLLQLPHIYDHNISYLRKNRIINCQDLANLKESKRRSLLSTIDGDQYEDVVYVLSMMPKLEIETQVEVQGEDDKETVTIGSVVTLKVTLKRSPLLDLSKRHEEIEQEAIANLNSNRDEHAALEDNDDQPVKQRKVWEKQPKKKPKKGKSGKPPPALKKKAAVTVMGGGVGAGDTNKAVEDGEASQTNTAPSTPKVAKSKEKKDNTANNSEEESEDSDSRSSSSESENDDKNQESEDDENDDDDDEEIWKEHEGLVKKEILLESEPTTHHEVHCPFYPNDKYEWWYLYLVERKSRRLISMVVPCKTLNQEKTLELKFSAPPQKGMHYFTLNVRSDSYMDCDYSMDLKIEVHEAREPPQVKYEDTEDEDEEKDLSASSDEYTEGSDSEEES